VISWQRIPPLSPAHVDHIDGSLIFTTDRDYNVYRQQGNQTIPTVIPLTRKLGFYVLALFSFSPSCSLHLRRKSP
jgi:hypothetical protein